MKRIIFALMTAMMFCMLVQGQNRTVTVKDSINNKKQVIELRDTVINGRTVSDTLSIMTYENESESESGYRHHHHSRMDWEAMRHIPDAIIAITAIVFVFGLPIIIVFFVFYFRYKNRRAKYHLAEQALANGQPLPENFFKNVEIEDIRSKGIKNIFLGLGLFIFLWAITTSFGLGCIGLLIMFTGFGQIVIYYTQQNKKGDSRIYPDKDEEK